MQQLVEMFPGQVSMPSGSCRQRNWLKLKNGPEVAVRVCRSIHLARNGRMWVLQATNVEHRRFTLMAGMNPEKTSLAVVFFAGGAEKRQKHHHSDSTEGTLEGSH